MNAPFAADRFAASMARRMGAIFTKFGRAPTTDKIFITSPQQNL
jgi:hypothetical protein